MGLYLHKQVVLTNSCISVFCKKIVPNLLIFQENLLIFFILSDIMIQVLKMGPNCYLQTSNEHTGPMLAIYFPKKANLTFFISCFP